MGTGKAARVRRVACQWKFKREQHDNKAINAMIERAEKIADGRAPLKKARFRDLRARPVFHHQREAIEAHLTVVFAALAVARHFQDAAGTSIKKIVQTLRTARSATIEINGQRLTLDPDLTDAARDILKRLESGH
jgi:hypothetical protein